MEVALIAFGIFLMAATLLPISRKDVWWVRIFDFPRAQLLVAAVVASVAFALLAEPYTPADIAFTAALGLCILYQSYMIYPYTFLARKQVLPSRHPRRAAALSLLCANVQMSNRNAGRLRRIVAEADPDIVLALETDRWWQAQLRPLEDTHRFTVQQPQDNTYGMLLYSRLELIDPQVRFLVEQGVPSIHARARLPAGQEVALHCLHPRPPFVTQNKTSTPRDAELMLIGREVSGSRMPVVVFGDLNDVAWSRTTYMFQRISRLLDPRIGRGFYNTFNAKYPLVRFPLDHFFHSADFTLVRFARLAYFGSDHFPVFIALSHEPDAGNRKAPRPDRRDRKAAERQIEKAV